MCVGGLPGAVLHMLNNGCTAPRFLCAFASKQACLVTWWTQLQLFLSLLFGTVFIWGTDLPCCMGHLLQPTTAGVSGSACPTEPVCLRQLPWLPVIWFALGIGIRLNKMVQGLQGQMLPPHTPHIPAFPKQPGQHATKAAMKWCGPDGMIRYCLFLRRRWGNAFEIHYSFLRKAFGKEIHWVKCYQNKLLLTVWLFE